MEIIQSKQNASIKSARKLLQRKHRKTSYLLEGWHLFEEAKASGAEILQVFVLEEMADRVANMAKVKLVSPEVLKELCETQTPQGIVAEVAKQSQALPESLSGKYLLLEDVQDPGNVGTMIRTADAAGYDGVFCQTDQLIFIIRRPCVLCREVISIFQSIVDLFLTWLRLAESKGYPSWQRLSQMSRLTIKQLRQMVILP